MSNGIVLDLQAELLGNDSDIVSILRKAHVIAKKLNLDQIDKWISFELNGYKNCSIEEIPEYRLVRGMLKAKNPYHGLIPVILNSADLESTICERKVPNSISEIINLINTSSDTLVMNLSGEQQLLINQMCNDYLSMEILLILPKSAVQDIVEKVKNAMLEWTLKLEEDGIIGEKMKFTGDEKKAAASLPQNINYFMGTTNYIAGSNNEVNQVVGDNNQISFSYDEVQDIVDGAKREIEKDAVTFEDKENILDIINGIDENIKSKKKPSIIKSALMGLKDFAFSVGATLLTSYLQSKLGMI